MVRNMAKYRILVSKDGKNSSWIVVDNGKLIMNPIKKDLEGTKLKRYNKTNICDKCREMEENDENEITDKSILYPRNAYKERDKIGKETGRWLCQRCYTNYDYHKRADSNHGIIKSLSNRRMGSPNPNSGNAKGDLGEDLTCGLFEVNNLNKENDNYIWPIDHSRHSILGILQTRCKWYDSINRCWMTGGLDRDWCKNFDNMVYYCISKDGKIVERIYIFPKEEVVKRQTIKIMKNPSKGILWYEKYRVKDEDVIRKVNKIWKEINKYNY